MVIHWSISVVSNPCSSDGTGPWPIGNQAVKVAGERTKLHLLKWWEHTWETIPSPLLPVNEKVGNQWSIQCQYLFKKHVKLLLRKIWWKWFKCSYHCKALHLWYLQFVFQGCNCCAIPMIKWSGFGCLTDMVKNNHKIGSGHMTQLMTVPLSDWDSGIHCGHRLRTTCICNLVHVKMWPNCEQNVWYINIIK